MRTFYRASASGFHAALARRRRRRIDARKHEYEVCDVISASVEIERQTVPLSQGILGRARRPGAYLSYYGEVHGGRSNAPPSQVHGREKTWHAEVARSASHGSGSWLPEIRIRRRLVAPLRRGRPRLPSDGLPESVAIPSRDADSPTAGTREVLAFRTRPGRGQT